MLYKLLQWNRKNIRYSTTRNPKSLCSIPLGSVTCKTKGTISHQCVSDWNTVLKKLSDRSSPKNWMKNLTSKELKERMKEYFFAVYWCVPIWCMASHWPEDIVSTATIFVYVKPPPFEAIQIHYLLNSTKYHDNHCCTKTDFIGFFLL